MTEMERSIRIVRTLDESLWRRFVEQHAQGNVFHTPDMFRVFACSRGHKPNIWAALDSQRCPLALLTPVQVTLAGGLLRLFTSRTVAYGSLLCAPGPESQAALAGLLDVYRAEMHGRVLFTELRNLADTADMQPVLRSKGFLYERHLNLIVDLDRPEQELWENISKSGRQSIRTSHNKGLVVEEATEPQQVAAAYGLLQEAYRRARVPLAGESLFQAAWDILGAQGMLKVLLARVKDQYVGTCFLLVYKGRMIDWYAAVDRAFASYSPGESLIWHAFQWGRAQHLRVFDFGGAGRPEEDYGPRHFKAKFGGELVEYGRNVCVHAVLAFQASKRVYAWVRQLFMARRSTAGKLRPDVEASRRYTRI